jgi:hypothetical protein
MDKTYDCIADKERIQRELWDEYQRRSGEFASYPEFIAATVDEDPEIREFRERIARARQSKTDRRTAA